MIEKLKIAAYAIPVALAIWFRRDCMPDYSEIGHSSPGPATNNVPGQTNLVVPRARSGDGYEPIHQRSGRRRWRGGRTGGRGDGDQRTHRRSGRDPHRRRLHCLEGNPLPRPLRRRQRAWTPSLAADAARGKAVGYLVAFVGALIGLGLLLTYDLAQFMGSRAADYLFTDVGEKMRDPEYERAEQAWVDGKPLGSH